MSRRSIVGSEKTWTTSELSEALNVYEQELRAKALSRNTINTYVQHPEREGSPAPAG